MKALLSLLIIYSSIAYGTDDVFTKEAGDLARELRTSLMHNLSREIEKSGPAGAVPYCHLNVKPIAKSAAGERALKYDFGRTSHKVRNTKNSPAPWAESYLKEYQGTMKGDRPGTPIIHKLPDGKKVYLEPLYVESRCLLCHGQNIGAPVIKEINRLYPGDKARGFKLAEFRGFLWVKEK